MSITTTTTDTIETNRATVAEIANKRLEQTVAALTDGMAKASAGVEQTQAKLKAGIDTAVKKTEEIVTFGQGNVEAVTKSAQIWAAGVQDLSKQVAASFQASVQETMGVVKTLGTVKSLKEAIELQSGFARTAVEKALSDSERLTHASLKLTEQALAPITERVRLASATFSKAA